MLKNIVSPLVPPINLGKGVWVQIWALTLILKELLTSSKTEMTRNLSCPGSHLLEVLANRIERLLIEVFPSQNSTEDRGGDSPRGYDSFKPRSWSNRITIARMNTSRKKVDFTKLKEPMLHLLPVDLYLNKRLCLWPAEYARSYSSFEDKGF